MFNLNSTRNILLVCVILAVSGCSGKDSAAEREKYRLEYEQRSEAEAKAVGDAFKKANAGQKDGFLELYRIGSNQDDKYAVEYQEAANDALTELLYTKTGLWIRAFSGVKGFKFYFGVLPDNITDEKYYEEVRRKLDNERWNKDEARLAEEIKRSLGAEPLRETLAKHVDVTGDGVPDEVRLDLAGEDWNKPLKWTLTITSKGKSVYEHSSDDAWLDKFFNDKGYVDNSCKNYLECKKRYYLHDLIESVLADSDANPNQNAQWVEEMHRVAAKELTGKFKLSAKEAARTVERMAARSGGGGVRILYLPKSPVQNECSMMYVPSVGSFVIVSDEL